MINRTNKNPQGNAFDGRETKTIKKAFVIRSYIYVECREAFFAQFQRNRN